MTEDPLLAEVVRHRFRHVLVDEAQDLNPVQFRLLACSSASRRDLFLVGDPAQAIYGFNGSDPTLLADVGRHLAGRRDRPPARQPPLRPRRSSRAGIARAARRPASPPTPSSRAGRRPAGRAPRLRRRGRRGRRRRPARARLDPARPAHRRRSPCWRGPTPSSPALAAALDAAGVHRPPRRRDARQPAGRGGPRRHGAALGQPAAGVGPRRRSSARPTAPSDRRRRRRRPPSGGRRRGARVPPRPPVRRRRRTALRGSRPPTRSPTGPDADRGRAAHVPRRQGPRVAHRRRHRRRDGPGPPPVGDDRRRPGPRRPGCCTSRLHQGPRAPGRHLAPPARRLRPPGQPVARRSRPVGPGPGADPRRARDRRRRPAAVVASAPAARRGGRPPPAPPTCCPSQSARTATSRRSSSPTPPARSRWPRLTGLGPLTAARLFAGVRAALDDPAADAADR